MDMVLRGGTVATARDIYTADVGIQCGSIAMIGQDLRGNLVLDVTGKYVFPGAVDPHTHLELEFMDTVSSDDFYTGTIAIGSDADLVVWDPGKEMHLTVENLHMNVDYSPYEHVTVRGYPGMVLARGKVIVEDNCSVGERGSGRFLQRRPFSLS